jgi:hypothetical protein
MSDKMKWLQVNNKSSDTGSQSCPLSRLVSRDGKTNRKKDKTLSRLGQGTERFDAAWVVVADDLVLCWTLSRLDIFTQTHLASKPTCLAFAPSFPTLVSVGASFKACICVVLLSVCQNERYPMSAVQKRRIFDLKNVKRLE